MTEASVRATLVKRLRQYKDWVVLRHEDHFTSGIPDISVTGNRITSWWETKFSHKLVPLTYGIKVEGLQFDILKKLARAGHAYYIIFIDATPKQIVIINPLDLGMRNALSINWDYNRLIQFLRSLHGLSL